MNTATVPCHAPDCTCDMCEDMPRFSKVPEREACEAAHVSPLARAALDCGVAFDDVLAYCQGRARAKVLP